MTKKYRFIGVVLAFLIIAGAFPPVPAGAVTTVGEDVFANYGIEQLQTLITKLQKRLDDLKKGTACYVADAELSLGDGEAEETTSVRRLQDFLREKGFFKLKSTGYFGKVTRAALFSFQKNNGLPETGVFDAATKAKAHALFCTTLAKLKITPKAEEKKPEVKKPEAKNETSNAVSSISATVTGATVSWTLNGYSKNGFKIVWSKNATPTYPTRDGDQYIYLSDPAARTTNLEAFSGSGSYHIRVCEYLGGACGVYSNELVTQL